MNKQEKIIANVRANKDLLKRINEFGFYYGNEVKDHKEIELIKIQQFVDRAQDYIKAIKDGRVICAIGSVSKSGMSRTMKFLECSKGKHQFNYLNFFLLFRIMGENPNRDGYFRINGCGMDMVFATNYNMIHSFKNLGIINDKQCRVLSQMTPSVI